MSLQEILRYISLLLAMQPPPLERPDFADDAMTPPAEQARPHLLRTGPIPDTPASCSKLSSGFPQPNGSISVADWLWH